MTRDIAHLSAVELYTAVPDQTVRFFEDLMAMQVVDRDRPRHRVPAARTADGRALRGGRRADLEDLVRSVWQRFGMTLVFVTHDIDESVYLGERMVVLSSSCRRPSGPRR